MKKMRVEWQEQRRAAYGTMELFDLIAEKEGDEWVFYEKTSWDILWVPVSPTPAHLAIARKELEKSK